MIFITPYQKKVLFLSSLGGVMEFYDFIIYIFLAPFIEQVFFAGNSNFLATLKTLAIFSIGYLLRPIGGLVFSHFGDRYGRKVVFLLTVIMMAVPSLCIGLLPTPAQIGALSPICLLMLRMMQGLALGGEIPASITFVSEQVPRERHGIALAILFFGINSGLLLGSLVTTIMTSYFSRTDMIAFGWRIPFIFGGIFGVVSVYLRRYLHETSAFSALKKEQLQRIPAITLLRNSAKTVILGCLLVATGSVTVFFYLYWPQYLAKNMQFDLGQLMKINTISTIVLNIFIIIGGLVVDRVGARRMYLLITSTLAILAYPLFTLFTLQSFAWVIVSYLCFSVIFGAIPSAYSSLLARLYPTQVRYSGIALSYNLAYAILGGLSPIVCTLAIHYTGNVLAPAFYILIVAVISMIACYLCKQKATNLDVSDLEFVVN